MLAICGMTDGASTVLRVLHRHQQPRCRQVLAPQRVSPHPPPERVSSDVEDEAAPSAALAAMELDAPLTPPPRAPPPTCRDHTDDGLFGLLPSEIILMIIKFIDKIVIGVIHDATSGVTLSRVAASCRTLRWAVRCVVEERDGTAHCRQCWQAMVDALPKHWSVREWRLPPTLAFSMCEGKDADQLLAAVQKLAVPASPERRARVTGVLLRTAGHAERRAGTLSATATKLEPPAGSALRRFAVGPYSSLGWKVAVQALSECWVGAALPLECSRIATMFSELADEVWGYGRADRVVNAWHVRLYAARNGRTPPTPLSTFIPRWGAGPLYEVLLLHAQPYDPAVSPAGRSHAYALILCPGRCAEDVDSAAALEAAYGLPPGRPPPPRKRWRRLLQQFKRREGWGSLWEL